jgi:predicted phage tail protein
LLKQLAAATTQTAIDSLKAQIRDVENAIAGDEAALRSLNNQINYSQVDVLVGTSQSPIVRHHHSSGFTLGKAAHDARRVLTVAAGVALITLAVLAPMLLVAALIAWVAQLLRRRRREQALDLA